MLAKLKQTCLDHLGGTFNFDLQARHCVSVEGVVLPVHVHLKTKSVVAAGEVELMMMTR
jgi:hypothetical protein